MRIFEGSSSTPTNVSIKINDQIMQFNDVKNIEIDSDNLIIDVPDSNTIKNIYKTYSYKTIGVNQFGILIDSYTDQKSSYIDTENDDFNALGLNIHDNVLQFICIKSKYKFYYNMGDKNIFEEFYNINDPEHTIISIPFCHENVQKSMGIHNVSEILKYLYHMADFYCDNHNKYTSYKFIINDIVINCKKDKIIFGNRFNDVINYLYSSKTENFMDVFFVRLKDNIRNLLNLYLTNWGIDMGIIRKNEMDPLYDMFTIVELDNEK